MSRSIIASTRRALLATVATVALAAAAQPVRAEGEAPLLPANAKAGECYARVLIPEQYQSATKQVVKNEGGEKVEVIPARFEPATEEVVVKEASSLLEVIPAKFETREEQVMVRPAETRLEATPAQYETVTEQVLVKAGFTGWKKGNGPIEKMDASTGEIMCLVEVPPVYEKVSRTVLKAPPAVTSVEIPAEYVTVKKVVMVEPPTTRTVAVPAETKVLKVQRLVEPAREVRTPIAPQYGEVTQTAKVSDSRLEWRRILCETNTTPDVVARVQDALRDAGYDPGPSDGSLGGKTAVAIRAFQQDKGLASGELTMETLAKLGVSAGQST